MSRLVAWEAAELCSARTVAGRFGNPPRVSMSIICIFLTAAPAWAQADATGAKEARAEELVPAPVAAEPAPTSPPHMALPPPTPSRAAAPPPAGQYPGYPPQPAPPPAGQYPGYPPQPAPHPWYPPPYAPYPWYPPPPPQPAPPPALPSETASAAPEPLPYTGAAPSRASWALQLESAQGVATGKFQNTLLAGHVDYAFAERTSLGGYLALASLKGKDRRVTALMPCALVTYEKPPGPGHSISFPLQFATGYLTRNGPVARLAAGLAWAIGKRTDLIFDLAAMAWVTRKEMLLSADLAIELRFRTN